MPEVNSDEIFVINLKYMTEELQPCFSSVSKFPGVGSLQPCLAQIAPQPDNWNLEHKIQYAPWLSRLSHFCLFMQTGDWWRACGVAWQEFSGW